MQANPKKNVLHSRRTGIRNGIQYSESLGISFCFAARKLDDQHKGTIKQHQKSNASIIIKAFRERASSMVKVSWSLFGCTLAGWHNWSEIMARVGWKVEHHPNPRERKRKEEHFTDNSIALVNKPIWACWPYTTNAIIRWRIVVFVVGQYLSHWISLMNSIRKC